MNKLKRAAAFLSALVMLAAVTPELPVNILNESYSITASAETTVTSETSAEDMAKLLLGGGSVTSATKQGDVSTFEDDSEFWGEGFDAGIILTSGNNGLTTTDPDLNKIVTCNPGGHTSIFEFEMVATGSLLNFDYAFASREFDQSDTYNDAFGLFVAEADEQGNYGEYENIAKIPDTELDVTINNLREGDYSKHAENVALIGEGQEYYQANYYRTYKSTVKFGETLDVNGISNVFTAQKAVTQGRKVKIKFVISDVGDASVDSAVAIMADSLSFNKRYSIVHGASENGSFKCSSKAEEGAEVELTAVPDRGYMIDTWTVQKESGGEVQVTDNKFTMPAEKVTVTPTFKFINYNLSYDANSAFGGSFKSTAPAGASNVVFNDNVTLPNLTGEQIENTDSEHYTFAGWTTEPYGVLEYEPGATVSGIFDVDQHNGVLYAYWKGTEHTVTLNTDGTTSQITAEYGHYMPAQEVPVKTGYTFKGYYTEQDGKGTQYYDADGKGCKIACEELDNNDMVLYAAFEASKYKVTFNANGGTVDTTSKEVTYGSAYGELPTPTRKGYNFLYWYDYNNYNSITSNSIFNNTSNLTLSAIWEPISEITVTLNPNGGSVSQASLTFEPGTSVTLPTPTRTGYTFGGWYNGSTLVTSTASITGNVTLTAKWTAVTYTVSFENCGGTGGESSLSIKHNAVLPATVSVPTLEGYAFDGYYTDENGGGIKCYDADGKRVYNSGTKGSFTLYANWVAPEYNVTFETNGGTMDSDLSSYTFGKGAVLPTDITRTGYTFAGWYTNEDFTGSPVTEISADESGDKTFYAKWNEIKYTVNVISELEDGTAFNATLSGGGKYSYDASVTVTAADMLGYDFKGWYEEDGTSPVSTSPSYTLDAKNVTLKAVYAKKSDTDKLTLEVNGAAFRINGGITQYGHCQLKYKAGTEITIEYVDTSKNFIYWKNETGKIVSIAKSHTFIMVDNTVMTANSIAPSNPDNAAVVEFISDTDQVLWSYSYTSTDLINFPSGPSKFGYEFTGWDKTNAEIQKEIADGAVRVVVKPVYKDVRQKYTITVAYPTGTIANDVYTNQVQGNGIDVTAKNISGKVFAYWSSDAQGKNVLGYSKSYFMRVTDNETVYAIYADQAVEKKPTIVMTDKFAGVSDGKNKVSFSASRDVTDKYSIIEQGILRSTDSTLTADTFIINATNVKKIRSTDTAGRGVFTLNISVGSSVDTVVYARGYMVLKNNETGMSEIIYSDKIFSGSYNSLK